MANPSKQGFQLGHMPLTLFILVAAAVLYIHYGGLKLPKGPGKVFGGEGETPTHEMTGPVQVVPQQGGPTDLPPSPRKVIVPAPGQAQ